MLHTLNTSLWTEPFSPEEQQSAISALEGGGILYLPHLDFSLNAAEKELLTPRILGEGSKNISFNQKTNKIKGVNGLKKDTRRLVFLMARFSASSNHLVNALLPGYTPHLLTGRTSFRPVEVAGRKTSILKDDTRLHVDSFSSTPNHGTRILRIFTNINPMKRDRVWQIGEPFERVVEHFLPDLHRPLFGIRRLLFLLNLTKSYRSLYDHYMLKLHDEMKKNEVYQQTVQKTTVHFPAGSTWVVMTDSVSHAAISGQFMLEQTAYLPVSGMADPTRAPWFVLERALGKTLLED